jgi:hypothetical protein
VTLAGKLHRLATGEVRQFVASDEPWRVEDGEQFVAEVPDDQIVELDGIPCVPLRAGVSRSYLIELGFQTLLGARRIEVRRRHEITRLDLITTGGLRAIERLLPAVSQVERWMPRVRGGFWYLDLKKHPRKAADPTRVLAFARDNGPRIATLVREIERQPATRRTTRISGRPLGFPLDVTATERLLQATPELLEQVSDGPLLINEIRYAPRFVACRTRQADLLATENRRLAAFLYALERDCRAATGTAFWLDAAAILQAQTTARALRKVIGQSFLSSVGASELPNQGDVPIGLELTHPCYRELRQMRIEYQAKATYGSWNTATRKHIASADRIYQAWCCYLVAHALGLQQTQWGLRASDGLAFKSTEWELYSDKSNILRSWRADTSRPDDYRPDILLRRRSDPSRVIIIDAKYAAADLTEAPGDRLKDVQAYMNSFGLTNVAIMHPGEGISLNIRKASAYGNTIAEIGVVPKAISTEKEIDQFRKAVLQQECSQGETFPNQSAEHVH